MSQYTIIDSSDADNIIIKDLDNIIKVLTSELGDFIRAIYLTGGFGRGEGAVILKDGVFLPLNDYDIEIVPKFNCKKKILKNLTAVSKTIDSLVSVKQVDLNVVRAVKLFIPFNNVKRFEIKNGHKLLWGKKTPINGVSSNNIPLIEGTTYYTNRMGGLLIAYLLLNEKSNYQNSLRIELSRLEINKAALAVGDAFLIQHRMYNYSYLKRKEIINRIKKEKLDYSFNEMLELYNNAVDERFALNRQEKSIEELNKEWFQTAKILFNTFLSYESNFYNRHFSNTKAYIEFMRKKPAVINNLKGLIYYQYSQSSIKIRIMFLLIFDYIVFEDKFAGYELKKNRKEFEINKVIKEVLKSWHPSGIIKEMS